MANRRSLWVVGVLAGLIWTGCGPSQEDLDAERAKVRDLQAQLEDA